MDRLEQIKNEVIQEDGNYRNWESYMDDPPYGASDYMVNEVARRYATVIAEDVRKRAVTVMENQFVPYDGSKDFYDEVAIKHFTKGMQEVIENPERYELYTKEQYEQALKDGYNQGLSDGARQTVDYVNKNILK